MVRITLIYVRPFGREITPGLGDLLTMVINHLLDGMILQVPPVLVGEKTVARSRFKVKVAHAARTPKPGNGSCLLVGWLVELLYTVVLHLYQKQAENWQYLRVCDLFDFFCWGWVSELI